NVKIAAVMAGLAFLVGCSGGLFCQAQVDRREDKQEIAKATATQAGLLSAQAAATQGKQDSNRSPPRNWRSCAMLHLIACRHGRADVCRMSRTAEADRRTRGASA